MIKRFLVSLAAKDSDDFPTTQVSYNGKTTDIEYLYPYGSHGVPPEGSIGVGFNILGYEENKAGIFYNSETRPKGLEPGEYACGNFDDETLAKFLNTGEINITSKTGSSIVIGEDGSITATTVGGGILTMDAAGNVAIIAAASVDITAAAINLNGVVNVSGVLNVAGFAALSGGAALGVGGAAIARVGDTVQVTGIATGPSTATGTITSGGSNTSN